MTTAIELTNAQIAHREACAYFKGILCGYADRKGHKYRSNRERENWSPAFEAGFKEGSDSWTDRDCITGTHILHNRLRNRPPHTEGNCNLSWTRGKLNMFLLGDLSKELEEVLNG